MNATYHFDSRTKVRVDENCLHVGPNLSEYILIFGTPEELCNMAHAILDKHEHAVEVSKAEGQEELNHEHQIELEWSA